MNQFKIDNNTFEIRVKPANLFVRFFFLFLSIIMVLLPLSGLVYNISEGIEFHIGYIIGLGMFSLFSFYFLRLYLWNTGGKEVITISQNLIEYYADYIYFKGNQQKINFERIVFDFESIGFEDEEKGVLCLIVSENRFIKCAAILPISELNKLIETLNKKYNSIEIKVKD